MNARIKIYERGVGSSALWVNLYMMNQNSTDAVYRYLRNNNIKMIDTPDGVYLAFPAEEDAVMFALKWS